MERAKRLNSSDEFIEVLKYYGIYYPEIQYKIICPFHGDKNPSMQISVQQSYFFCYGCGVHGSTYELVKLYESGLNGIQIYQKIREICNGKTSREKIEFIEEDKEQLLEIAKDYYYNLPDTNWYKKSEAKEYMRSRGYTVKSLIESGAKETFNSNYPIVFPIYDNKEFCGYVMRTNRKDVEENRKYLYNKGFRRKLTLSGQYKINKPLLLVEGYLDKIAANQVGVNNVAALLGWKISQDHLEKIKKKHIKTIICGLDNDEAGNKGYAYLKRISEQNGFEVKRLRFKKDIKDFGDIIKLNREIDIISQLKKFDLL